MIKESARDPSLKNLNEGGDIGPTQSLLASTSNPRTYASYIASIEAFSYSRHLRHAEHLFRVIEEIVSANCAAGNQSTFLIVGLGQAAEEVYEHALYAYSALRGKCQRLDQAIDIEMVDLQPRSAFVSPLSPIQLPFQTYDDDNCIGRQIDRLIVRLDGSNKSGTYPASVRDFVESKLADESRLHDLCALEDFAGHYRGRGFDLVSANNIVQYLGVGDCKPWLPPAGLSPSYSYLNPTKCEKPHDRIRDFEQFRAVIESVFRLVRPGGHMSCSTMKSSPLAILDDHLSLIPLFCEEFRRIRPGLFMRAQ